MCALCESQAICTPHVLALFCFCEGLDISNGQHQEVLQGLRDVLEESGYSRKSILELTKAGQLQPSVEASKSNLDSLTLGQRDQITVRPACPQSLPDSSGVVQFESWI